MTPPAMDALIGHTGFVGSNLLRQHPFAQCYNSANIESIRGQQFDLVVCAGVRAEKWIANANPEQDRARIDRLLDALSSVRAEKVVLISTVDVFAAPVGVDEASPTESAKQPQPYGINRRHVEEALSTRFDTLIVRLPGLYGPGIKKNVIHDFLYEHEIDKIDSRGRFQFYGLDRLWSDIGIGLRNNLPLAHLVTEAVTVREVVRHAFDREWENEVVPTPATYDLHTRYAPLFGGEQGGAYIEDRVRVLDGIRQFVAAERRAGRGGSR